MSVFAALGIAIPSIGLAIHSLLKGGRGGETTTTTATASSVENKALRETPAPEQPQQQQPLPQQQHPQQQQTPYTPRVPSFQTVTPFHQPMHQTAFPGKNMIPSFNSRMNTLRPRMENIRREKSQGQPRQNYRRIDNMETRTMDDSIYNLTTGKIDKRERILGPSQTVNQRCGDANYVNKDMSQTYRNPAVDSMKSENADDLYQKLNEQEAQQVLDKPRGYLKRDRKKQWISVKSSQDPKMIRRKRKKKQAHRQTIDFNHQKSSRKDVHQNKRVYQRQAERQLKQNRTVAMGEQSKTNSKQKRVFEGPRRNATMKGATRGRTINNSDKRDIVWTTAPVLPTLTNNGQRGQKVINGTHEKL